MPYEGKDEYWESHQTKYGKRDRMSQGSVADRGGYNNMEAYTQENMGPAHTAYGKQGDGGTGMYHDSLQYKQMGKSGGYSNTARMSYGQGDYGGGYGTSQSQSMSYGSKKKKSHMGYGFGKKKDLTNRNMNYGGGY